MLWLNAIVVNKMRTHVPGHSVRMFVVKCKDDSAIQVPPGMAYLNKPYQAHFVTT